jgi:hypothetical protein
VVANEMLGDAEVALKPIRIDMAVAQTLWAGKPRLRRDRNTNLEGRIWRLRDTITRRGAAKLDLRELFHFSNSHLMHEGAHY